MRLASALAAICAATFVVVVAPAGNASADESAIVVIGTLEAQGYTVNVDRVGSAPLQDCIVTDVRNPQQQTQRVPVGNDHDDDGHWPFSGGDDDYVEVVVSQSISVSLDCTG
ncbi:MAG: hypothetical protein ACSLE6_19200 [Mycobacterium sp.]